MGCVRNKMGKHLHNPRQQGNTSANHSPSTIIHKLKVSNLFGKRDLLHVYIILKQ